MVIFHSYVAMLNHWMQPYLAMIPPLTQNHTGWWLTYPSEKYETYDFVNGKDDIPYMKWKIKHVWNKQPAYNPQHPTNQ